MGTESPSSMPLTRIRVCTFNKKAKIRWHLSYALVLCATQTSYPEHWPVLALRLLNYIRIRILEKTGTVYGTSCYTKEENMLSR
jgi:hypothetical protein